MTQTLLTRDIAFPQNMDPTGKVWSIFKHDTHPSMFVVNCSTLGDTGDVIPRTNVSIPRECIGEWTHPQRAQAVIEQYLNRMWKMSDEKTKHAAAAERAKVERIAQQKEEAELLALSEASVADVGEALEKEEAEANA